MQAWEADPFTLYRIPTETLRHLLMATKPYVIGKDGINFKSRKYCHSKLNGHGGERVVLRHIPDDPDFVEVYLRGEHLCTAYPREQLSKEQEDAIIDARRTDEAGLKHLVGEARKASTEQLILAGDVANAQQATSTGPPADASGEVSVEAPPPAADSAADQAGDQGRVRGTRRAPRHQATPAPAPARAAREQRNLLTSYNLLGLVDPFDDPDLDPDSYGQEPVDLSGYHQPDEGPAPGPR